MRVAHIITRMIVGGAQENTLLCCRDLVQQFGDQVLLITGPALGPEGSMLSDIPADGVNVRVIDSMRRAIQPLRDWLAYREILRVLKGFRPDVVHTHSAKAGMLGRLAAWKLGIPAIVHTVHGAPFHDYQGRGARTFFRACERFAACRCHRLVSVSNAMTELLVDAGVAPREMFTTVYSGMNVQPFLDAQSLRESTRKELGFDPQDFVIGKVARLFHLKGHADVIAAAGGVVEKFPHVRFLFVGDGILKNRLQRQVSELGLERYFQFHGLAPPDRIPALLAATDAVVHASLREGLARVIPQAQMAGKPVVSYDVDGAREVIEPGKSGYLVPAGDVDQLTSALAKVVSGEPVPVRPSTRQRERIQQSFDHQEMTRRLRNVYTGLLARSG